MTEITIHHEIPKEFAIQSQESGATLCIIEKSTPKHVLYTVYLNILWKLLKKTEHIILKL